MLMPGQPRCIKGSVAATMDYSGIALIGLNLNQAQSTGAPLMTVVPKRGGLDVAVTNNASSPLRIQVQGPNGETDANDRWCAVLSGSGGFVPWSMFNTACWDGSGMPYAMQPLAAAVVLVPGDMASAIAFDFCLNSLAESDGGAAGSGGTGAAAGSGSPAAGSGGAPAAAGSGGSSGPVTPGMNSGSGTLTDRYASAMVMRDGRNYVVQNNVWGNTSMQSVKYDGTTFEITQQTGMNVASGPNAGAPVSYPSAFIGSNNNRATTGSNLPKQVSALTTVKTGWTNNAGAGISGTYNAAYDVWFSTGAGGDPAAPSGGYLMVWYYKPSDAQPIGMRMQAGVSISGAAGSWDVWLGQNGGKPCISYVRTQSTTSLEYDLNAFIKDATARPGAIQSSWYLSNVFAGFEIWNGGVGLKTSSFYAIVE
jgi:cellulose 1,4-beta-cellobiosidase